MTTPAFRLLLADADGTAYVERVFATLDRALLLERWYRQTGEAGEIYPSQGLLSTPYDYLPHLGKTLLGDEETYEVLEMRHYVLSIFNHPTRLKALRVVDASRFVAPPVVASAVMEHVRLRGLAMGPADLGAAVVGGDQARVGRRDLLQRGPFVKLGASARVPFASGAMPDVFGAPASIATMAMCHGLACVPRNGVFSQVSRQVDLVTAAFAWMRDEELLLGRKDARWLLKRWRKNVVGVVEPELTLGMQRAEALYTAGVRSFRVYSPEPGTDAEDIVMAMKKQWGEKVEVFVGQVAGVEQAKRLEGAGADGLYTGIGGGGRCITAVRSSSVVDWPNLVWQLRGEVGIPVIVEGGASDHVGTSLLLGVSGIGVSRLAAGGTIEAPGGLLYWVDHKGKWFKPYGGEASARTKYQDGKMLALGLPAFVEGETTQALKSYITHVKPTVAANMYFLLEDVILSLVFRGVASIQDLQAIDPSPLRRITTSGEHQQGTH